MYLETKLFYSNCENGNIDIINEKKVKPFKVAFLDMQNKEH